MKKGSYLINTARGPLLDYEALHKALSDGHLRGAALDTFYQEPLPENHIFKNLNKIRPSVVINLVSSLSDDVINSVPQSLRDGSYAVGATKSETIKQVVIPAALPGIIGSVLLLSLIHI